MARITHLRTASAAWEQPSPPASSQVPGPRFWVTSPQVNPHPVTSAAAPVRHLPVPGLLGLPKAVLRGAASPVPVPQTWLCWHQCIQVRSLAGQGWFSHQPGASRSASQGPSWFCFVGDLAWEPPVPRTAQDPCATPRKLRLTPSPGCLRTMGTAAKSCWRVLGPFGAQI